jgi:hypothetical protein
MSLNTYQDLIGEIVDVLADESLDAKAPTFIQMAEAKFNRILNTLPQEQRATHVLEAGEDGAFSPYITIPAQFSGIKRLTLLADTNVELEYLTPLVFSEKFVDEAPGIPIAYTIEGVQIKLGPTPGGAYTVEQVYSTDLRPLSDKEGEESNWLLRQAPDTYLYTCLVQAEMYLVDDARMPAWKELSDTSLVELRRWDIDNRYPSGMAMPAGNAQSHPSIPQG